MAKGLSHMTFIVSDLDRMEVLLTTVLNARKVYDSGERDLLGGTRALLPRRRWCW
jgi:hypothetical protein